MLERQCRAGRVHLFPDFGHHFTGPALQKQHGRLDVGGIINFADEPDAGGAAATDLMQHAWTRAMREHRVLAGAQLKDLLQHGHAFAHGPRTGVGSEIAMLPVEPAAVKAQLRKCLARDAHVRVGLVVAEEDVVARLVRLDEVVFKQQGLALGARNRGLDLRHLRQHQHDACRVRAALEIACHALPEILRLADIERGAGGVIHPVHAGTMRQRRDQFVRIERRRRFIAPHRDGCGGRVRHGCEGAPRPLRRQP